MGLIEREARDMRPRFDWCGKKGRLAKRSIMAFTFDSGTSVASWPLGKPACDQKPRIKSSIRWPT